MKNAMVKLISVTTNANKNTCCEPNIIALASSVCLVGAEDPCKYFSMPLVRMTIAIAVPIAPATCCSVFMTAVPCGYSSGGSWFRPFVCAGIQTMEMPIISPICKEMIKAIEDADDMLEKNHNVTATTMRPGITSHFGPYLSNKRPMRGDRMPFSALPGSSISPAVNADSFIPF